MAAATASAVQTNPRQPETPCRCLPRLCGLYLRPRAASSRLGRLGRWLDLSQDAVRETGVQMERGKPSQLGVQLAKFLELAPAPGAIGQGTLDQLAFWLGNLSVQVVLSSSGSTS